MQRNISAVVTDIIPLTKDSAEIVFIPQNRIDFIPGQFLMIEILKPREDETWQIMSPEKLISFMQEKNLTSKEKIQQFLPYLETSTIETFLRTAIRKGYIVLEEDTIKIKECPMPKIIPLKRAYSIGSAREDNHVSTIVKEMPGGFMSHYLLKRLHIGDEVLLTGPAGKFTYDMSCNDNVLLIGAGSGITPFLSMLRTIQKYNLSNKVTLLYSNKTPEDIISKLELDDLSALPNITVYHTITRAEQSAMDWRGGTGRIDASLLTKHLNNIDAIYICGPLAFGKTMKTILIEECQIKKEIIHMEAYG